MICSSLISCMAYADDLVFFAESPDKLQNLFNIASNAVKAIGMSFRASKCAILDIPYKKNTHITIDHADIPHLEVDEGYMYLGSFIGRIVTYTPEKLFSDILTDLNYINMSLLPPWQKLHAYMLFEHSKFIFNFRNSFIPYGKLTESVTGWDINIRRFFKDVLGVPDNTSTPYIYVSRSNGGVGMTSAIDEYIIQSISHSFYMLNSTDPNISEAANVTLRRSLPDRSVGFDDALSWLNTYNKERNSWWNKIQQAIHVFKDTHGVLIRFLYSYPRVVISISQNVGGKVTLETINSNNKDKLTKILRNCVSNSYLDQWNEQNSAGRYSVALSQSAYSTSPIYNGRLTIAEWQFIHQARSYTIPVRCRPGVIIRIPCRRGRSKNETLAHVLVGYNSLSNFWNARHNAVLDIFATEIKAHSGGVVHVNETCRYVPSTKRVDLQIFFESINTLFLLDVKCPYDPMHNLENADRKNVNKYFPLMLQIKDVCGYKVVLDTIIVGALGAWWTHNEDILDDLNLSFRKKAIANACVESNIRWSCRQWEAFQDPREQNTHRHEDVRHDPNAGFEVLQEGPIFDECDSDSVFGEDHGLW